MRRGRISELEFPISRLLLLLLLFVATLQLLTPTSLAAKNAEFAKIS